MITTRPGNPRSHYCWMCKQTKAPDYFTLHELTHYRHPFCEECYKAAECIDRPTARELTKFGVEMEGRQNAMSNL